MLYVSAAVAVTWPAIIHFATALPGGTERVGTVPLFNAWTIWWNADSAARGFVGYWDAPIFHPTADSFAFSETQLTTLAVAPVVWVGGSPTVAYNVYLLGTLIANAWMGRRLLRQVGVNLLPAFLGGLMVELLPFVHWQLDVLQLVPLWGVLWTLAVAWRFGEKPQVRTGLAAGLAFGITYLACNHYGLFLSLLLLPACPLLLGRRLVEWQAWKKLLPGALLCSAVVAPVVLVQLRAVREHDMRRETDLVRRLSAEWGDYSTAFAPQLLPLPEISVPRRRADWPLSPGSLKWLLAAAGVLGGMIVKRFRRWTLFCIVMLSAAVLLSQGPKLRFGSAVPYHWLADVYPGLAQVRSIFRFAVFAQLTTALLAAQGLALLAEFLARRVFKSQVAAIPRSWNWRVAGATALTAVIGGCAAVEVWPTEQNLIAVPSLETHRSWIGWLRTHTRPDDVIAHAPFPRGGDVGDYEETAEWMYLQSFHGRRMVNGYSGFFPNGFRELKSAMQGFPDEWSFDALRNADVRFCIVRRDGTTGGPLPPSHFRRVFADDRAGVDIYRLRRTTPVESARISGV
ncbi:MAG: hypothetical protein ACE5KM_08680, partial [Planctomycetaceae bacterium]